MWGNSGVGNHLIVREICSRDGARFSAGEVKCKCSLTAQLLKDNEISSIRTLRNIAVLHTTIQQSTTGLSTTTGRPRRAAVRGRAPERCRRSFRELELQGRRRGGGDAVLILREPPRQAVDARHLVGAEPCRRHVVLLRGLRDSVFVDATRLLHGRLPR